MSMKLHSRDKFNVTLFFALLFHIYTEKARNDDKFQRVKTIEFIHGIDIFRKWFYLYKLSLLDSISFSVQINNFKNNNVYIMHKELIV